MKKVLVIDADETDRLVAAAILAGHYEVKTCRTVTDALVPLAEAPHCAIILDLDPASTAGIEAPLRTVLKHGQGASVLCASSSSTTKLVVSAMLVGASGFLDKPFRPDILLPAIRWATARSYLDQHPSEVFAREKEGLSIAQPEGRLIGHSMAMREVFRRIEQYAKHDAAVLIMGESGTGKELAAKAIHDASLRSGRRFQAVDCASIPEGLAESELFGTERGAFTGAISRQGLFEAADGGTVFLDEVGELHPSVQAKLLRVLESGTGARMGSTKTLHYNVRVISATNADIYMRDQNMRPELINRLDTLVLQMPALRDHKDDIPELVQAFLARSPTPKTMTPKAMTKLTAWHWPGNVRELRNVVLRAIVLSGSSDDITSDDIELMHSRMMQPRLF